MALNITVVGIGPGHPDYLIPLGEKAIQRAEILVGSVRALQDFGREGQEQIPITGSLSVLKDDIKALPDGTNIVVLVSGDPGYYSLLTWLKKHFSADSRIRVIPGLSSMQVAFSRLGETWYDAELLSFHGRRPSDESLQYTDGKKLGFLTDKVQNPAYIAAELIEKGWPKDTFAAALERISYEDEQIVQGTLEEIQKLKGFSHSILVVIAV